MRIIIKHKTPTINHLYFHWKNRTIMTREAKILREKIQIEVKNQIKNCDEIRDKPLSIRVDIFENWFTKKGNVKKLDIANREKFLVDSVFKALGIDDKFIWEQTMTKRQSEEEKAVIEINPAEEIL